MFMKATRSSKVCADEQSQGYFRTTEGCGKAGGICQHPSNVCTGFSSLPYSILATSDIANCMFQMAHKAACSALTR